MPNHDPEFLHYFAHGQYDRLFVRYRNWHEGDDLVHLVATGTQRDAWALIRPGSNRAGLVLWSNCLPWGAQVRSLIPWKHAARPRRPGHPGTNGDPRRLVVVRTARGAAPKPGRFLPFVRRPALARLAA